MSVIHALWNQIRTFFRMLILIRFSLLLGLLGVLLFWRVPQGEEILRHLAEAHHPSHQAFFLLAALICAGSTWYCARQLFKITLDARLMGSEFRRLRQWLPRLLGASIPVALAVGIWLQHPGSNALQILLVVAAIVFLGAVSARRRLPVMTPFHRESMVVSFRELSKPAKAYFVASTILYVLCVVVFATGWGQAHLATSLGAGAVVLLGLGLLIPLGTMLVYAGTRKDVPLLGALIAWGILISPLSDNHKVRTSKDATGITGYQDLADYYRKWRQDLLPAAADSVPVYVVCAEGGGIRAAYWTALVLGRLQDASPDGSFARHVFAISGVSGGSLGASMFAAQVASPNAATFVKRTRAMLEKDALSPTLSSFVFPDMFQRLIPRAVFPDRAKALETSWERAWDEVEPEAKGRFAAPMDLLWASRPFVVPLLFLNSTVVESGDRIIVQPLAMGRDGFDHTFRQALNARDVIAKPVRLSTAAHMSARFTYVSPAGSIERHDVPDKWIRVVDGGYFENSGAVTAEEILRMILEQERTLGGLIRVVVLHISNDPVSTCSHPDEPVDLEERRIFLGEALSPLRALLHTRSARGFQARQHLQQEFEDVEGRDHVHFCLHREGVDLPLGWLLSDKTFQEMDRQLDEENGANVADALRGLRP